MPKFTFQTDDMKSNCEQRIYKAGLHYHLIYSSDFDIDKVNNNLDVLFGDEMMKTPVRMDPFSKVILDDSAKKLKKWTGLKVFSYVISALLIYIDQICVIFKIMELASSRKSLKKISYNKKTYNTWQNLIDAITVKERKITNLDAKLKFLASVRVISQHEKENIKNLYKTRNCIEHWDGYIAPACFKGQNKNYTINIPTYEACLKNITTGKISPVKKGVPAEGDSELFLKIKFKEKTYRNLEEIIFSYTEIANFISWSRLLTRNIHVRLNEQIKKQT